MGIGDWGLGIGDWAQSPIPNWPCSTIGTVELNCNDAKVTTTGVLIGENYVLTSLPSSLSLDSKVTASDIVFTIGSTGSEESSKVVKVYSLNNDSQNLALLVLEKNLGLYPWLLRTYL